MEGGEGWREKEWRGGRDGGWRGTIDEIEEGMEGRKGWNRGRDGGRKAWRGGRDGGRNRKEESVKGAATLTSTIPQCSQVVRGDTGAE